MDNGMKNKRNMYNVVLETCKDHVEIWENIPEFEKGLTLLESKLDEFTATAKNRLLDTKHITKMKASLMAELYNKVYSVVKIIRAYALTVEDDKLLVEYSMTKESLIKGGAKATVSRYSNVMRKAEELAISLEGYGLTPQFLQELKQQVIEANDVIMEPRLRILKRKSQTRRLKELSEEIDTLIYIKLTAMVDLLQYNHPSFFDQFMDARNIIDLRARRANKSYASEEYESPPAPEIDDAA